MLKLHSGETNWYDPPVRTLADIASGGIGDASATVKAATKLSVNPVVSTNPIAVGDNDSRVQAATTSTRGLQKTSVAPATAGDPISLAQNDSGLESHITGLRLVWNSATSLSITSGAAYIPGLSRIYNVPNTITKSSLTFTANRWNYIYLFDNASAPDIQIVDELTANAAPSAAYKGVARTRSGDTSKRFLGAIRTNAAGTAMLKFVYNGDWVEYRENLGASPLLLLSSGTSTTEATVSAASVVPTTARRVILHCRNLSTNVGFQLGSSEDTITTLGASNFLATIYEVTSPDVVMTLDSSQALAYKYDAAASGANVSLRAYLNER